MKSKTSEGSKPSEVSVDENKKAADETMHRVSISPISNTANLYSESNKRTMPRRTPPLTPNQYYHLYNRGNDRGCIFFEEENYLFFLRKVRQYLSPVIDIVAYCLMPTHYHFLVRINNLEVQTDRDQTARVSDGQTSQTSEVSETSEVSDAVSNAMMRLSVSYTKAINKRFDRVGSLFQGAYRAKHIEDESYLVRLSQYVHRNPVTAGLVEKPAEWRFSSYRDFIGERRGELPHPEVVLAAFDSRDAYRRFVEAPPRQNTEEGEWKNALCKE